MTSLYPYLAHPAHPKQFTDAAAVSLSRSRLRLRSLPFPFASPHWLEWLRALSAHGVTTLQVSLGQRPSLCDSSVSRAGPAIVCSHSPPPARDLLRQGQPDPMFLCGTTPSIFSLQTRIQE